jgi:beta-glucosidase
MMKTWLIAALVLLGFAGATYGQSPTTRPWLNPDMPTAGRVESLMSQLTMTEKIGLTSWLAPAIDRLGIDAYHHGNEGLHGLVRPGKNTVFPESIGLAATFDPDLIHDMAVAISDEARARYNQAGGKHLGQISDTLVLWAPVVNMARDPRWGRTQETYGEDPWLTSRMGVAYVRGMQGDDPRYLKVVATLKHFAGNNEEQNRFGKKIVADQRYLHEYELAGFRAAIQEAKCRSVMAAYTAVNGVPDSCNPYLLKHVLRDMWGFQGYVVSDCGAMSHVVDAYHYMPTPQAACAECFNNGLDMEGGWFAKYPDMVIPYMPAALKEGLIKPEVIDAAVSRILTARFDLGMFDPADRVPYSKIAPLVIGSPEHIALARRIADESMVLLKNDRLLPIDTTAVKKMVVVGPYANVAQFGDYAGNPTIKPVTPLAGITVRAGKAGIEVTSIPWPNPKAKPPIGPQDLSPVNSADLVIAVVGISTDIEIEGKDRKTLTMPADQEAFVKDLLERNPRTVVVLNNGSPIAEPWMAEHVPAIVDAWYPGEEGGDAIADVLFGDVNPAGRLPLTFYASDAQLRPMSEYDITKGRTYLYLADKPLYPFGHGLSYTTFDYSNLKLSASSISANGHATAIVTVKNTGSRAGDEVVQCYVHAHNASVPMPSKQLWAFKRITLAAGESKDVSLELNAANFGHWDQDKEKFVVEPGDFDVMVGASSADIRQQTTLTVTQ